LAPIPTNTEKTYRLWLESPAAASVSLCLSIGGYFLVHKPQNLQVVQLKPGTFKNDVLPGDEAILTSSGGKEIAVNSAKSGSLAQQGASIFKKQSWNLVFNSISKYCHSGCLQSFTTRSRGGKHSLQLADGTLAILAAGSCYHLPCDFTGKEGQVKMTGARFYFEVVHQ